MAINAIEMRNRLVRANATFDQFAKALTAQEAPKDIRDQAVAFTKEFKAFQADLDKITKLIRMREKKGKTFEQEFRTKLYFLRERTSQRCSAIQKALG